MPVLSCLTLSIDADPHGQIGVGRDRVTRAAGVPIVHVDEGLLGVGETVLDHAGEGMRPELAAHLLDPLLGLPRGDRRVRSRTSACRHRRGGRGRSWVD